MKKQIFLNDEAKVQLLEGAKALYDAVSATLGPKGQNAVIEAYGEPIVTHDGVTVAKAIDSVKDLSPGARVGIEMIKASSSKTNDNVGDGTTSSTILAYHLIDEGMNMVKLGVNPMILRRELEDAAQQALTELDKVVIPVKTEKAAIEIATISSEDSVIGKEVGKMYHKLGKDAMVAVEIGSKPVTEYEIVEGYTFDRGFVSPMMITDSATHTANLLGPTIVIAKDNVSLTDSLHIIREAYADGRDNIVFIADDFKNDFIDYALAHKNEMEIIGIKAPGFGDQRLELLKDIAQLCRTKVFGNGMPSKLADCKLADLGICDKIVVTAEETVITGGQDVSEYIKELEVKLSQITGEFDREKMEKRIAKLRAKIGQIRVGGNTEMEAEERKYRIDDAVAATEAALKDGIVPGGGTTYIHIAKSVDVSTAGGRLLVEALKQPFKVLMNNSGYRYGKKLTELQGASYGQGFDVMSDGELVDLKEHGVIDPALVIKQAITNAVSVAGSVLTTGVLIINDKEKNEEEE